MQVRKKVYPSGRVKWQVDLGYVLQEDGSKRRDQKYYDSKDEADGKLKEAKAKRRSYGDSSIALSEADRILFTAARDRLRALGGTIEQAIDAFERTARVLKTPVVLSKLLADCVAEKEALGMKKRSVQQFRCSCLSFIRGREETLSHEVRREDVQTWVLGNKWAPKTQRVYLGDLRALFSWALEKGYASENPCTGSTKADRVKVAKMPDQDISAFGTDACERLLNAALGLTERRFNKSRREWEDAHVYRPLLGYITLATFAGIRPEEVKRSPRSAVHLNERTAVVSGGVAKTSRRRAVDLHDNAVEWLKLWLFLCPEERLIIPRNFRRLWDNLRKRAKLSPWPHDVLRHTFASMHFAFYKDRSRLQAELGHSEDEDTLERHYKSVHTVEGAIISRNMAERFWNLFPPPRVPMPSA